jgi:hypothetical protein
MAWSILNQNYNKPCPIRIRPAITIIKIVTTLQITKTIFRRFATDTLSALMLISITTNE